MLAKRVVEYPTHTTLSQYARAVVLEAQDDWVRGVDKRRVRYSFHNCQERYLGTHGETMRDFRLVVCTVPDINLDASKGEISVNIRRSIVT